MQRPSVPRWRRWPVRTKPSFYLALRLTAGWRYFPRIAGQDPRMADALANKLVAPILHTLVHDDDIFMYRFYEQGKLAGTYNSCPDYFGESSEPRGGDVDLLQTILPDREQRNALRKILDADGYTFEVERLHKFVELLGLPNGVGAYEYLQDGERDGIKRWKEFVHIPDLTGEKNAKRAAKARATADMKQLAKDGLLVLDIAAGKTEHPNFFSSPVWCIDESTKEVLLAWTGSPTGSAGVVNVSRVNAQTGNIVETTVQVSSHISCLAASSDGAWLAAGCACGDWKTQICDLKTGKLTWEIPQSRAVSQVCFNQSGQTLYSLSENIITVIGLQDGKVADKISLPGGSHAMLLHPSGEYLVAECEGLFTLVHLPSQEVLKSLWIQQPPGPKRDLMEQIARKNPGQKFLDVMAAAASSEESEKRRRQMERHFLPKQPVHSLSFGTLGNCLFCGGHDGVNVILWDKILAASDMEGLTPQAYIPAEKMVQEDATSNNNLIYMRCP